jgi:hypothetical protein
MSGDPRLPTSNTPEQPFNSSSRLSARFALSAACRGSPRNAAVECWQEVQPCVTVALETCIPAQRRVGVAGS